MDTTRTSEGIDQDRRRLLGTAAVGIAAVGAASLLPSQVAAASTSDAIRPFTFSFPPEDIDELRRRIAATRWPDRELVSDEASRRIWSTPATVGPTQGVQLATMQKLMQYWGTEYDWSKCEARLKALPNFVTEIDGVDIHFIHVKSKHQGALPVIITHGWPGSVIELLKIIDPFTNPTAHGGTDADAFDVVIPSMPGYGFSGKPTETGWDSARIARAWIVLMQRLGYDRYVAQGGDWGALITEQMALIAPPELVAIHTNMPGTIPPEIVKALASGSPPPADLGPDEKRAYEQVAFFYKNGLGYANEMALRPQTLYGIVDSPAGLAAWILDHDADSYALIARSFDGEPEGLTRDDILDNITFYWLTNTAISSARLYWEHTPNGEGGLLRRQRHHHSRRRDCEPQRNLHRAEELDRTRVPETSALRPHRQGLPFRGLGTAEDLHR